MLSRAFIAGEESMPGFKASKDRLTLLIRANVTVDLKLKPMLIYHLPFQKILELLRIVLNLLCLCSINGTTKPEWQHGLLNILSPLLRPTAQKKKFFSLKILPLTDNAPDPPRILVEIYNEINVIFMPANKTFVLQPINQGVISSPEI